jgi:hypothetical protein
VKAAWLVLLASAWGGPLGAADFIADPKAMCAFLAASGMKAQLEWSRPQADGPYFCKYAEQFSGGTAVIRGGSAAVDPSTGEVTLSLVVQAFSMVRVEAAEPLRALVAEFYRAQGQSVPEAVAAIIGAKTAEVRKLPAYTAESTAAELWEEQRALGLSFTGRASAATLAAVGRGPSLQEKAATEAVKKALGERCLRAIAESSPASSPAPRPGKATQLSASRYLFEYTDAAGGTYSCQACDEADRKVNCAMLGVLLTHAPKGESPQSLPAEFDRKCVFYLQHELMEGDSGVFIDHALVERIRVSPAHTEGRWAYQMVLDGQEYRCVIRKSDWSFRLEGRAGAEWRGLTAGRMF